jgi:hypothetical protein
MFTHTKRQPKLKMRKLSRLERAMAGLLVRSNGYLRANPYLVPEFKEALQALKESTGYKGDWMDVPVRKWLQSVPIVAIKPLPKVA